MTSLMPTIESGRGWQIALNVCSISHKKDMRYSCFMGIDREMRKGESEGYIGVNSRDCSERSEEVFECHLLYNVLCA